MPPPAPKPPVSFSVDSTDKFLVAYHCEGSQDLADVVFHVNGVLHADINYRVNVAADRKSILWQRAIGTICFSKRILEAILKGEYSASSHRAVAYDDVAQEMHEKKILPERKLYWGAPQVVRLKWECTGGTTIIKCDYKINYVNVDSKGRKNRQCNSVRGRRSARRWRQRPTLGRSASLVHSARAATGVAATLPAHLRDVRRVRDATAATVGTKWTTMRRRNNSLKRKTMMQTTEAEVGVAVVGNARVGGTNGSIVT